MRKNRILLVCLALLTFCFISCASIQKDVVMTTDSFIQTEDVISLEQRFIEFDAGNIINSNVEIDSAIFSQTEILIKDIENCIKVTGMNEPVISRLYALEGLTCLLQGYTTKAKTLYNKSYEANKGDSYTVILGYRLGIISSIQDENIISASNENSLLELEQGLAFYKIGEYAKCVAQLDSAFINLPEYYKLSYNEIRQKAWNLRNNLDVTDDKSIIAILNKSQITVGEMILITQDTTDFLYIINGGKRFSETDLFNHLMQTGYFDSVSYIQNVEKNKKLKKNEIVNRQICARFMWNIYCIKKNFTDEKTKNSQFYRNEYGMSPIPDVELNCEDFDAILGVVENEIMDLPDGENFSPESFVAASDFNAWLQKIN